EPQRGGLAGAVGAEQSETFARTQTEVEPTDDFAVAIGFAQPGGCQRHGGVHAQWRCTICDSKCSRPWKKCSPPGTTTIGSCCGRAQSSTAASGTTSSTSPWITSVSAGTVAAGKRLTAGPTSTSF